MKAETTFSLKDQLFNKQKVTYLAGLIGDVHDGFDTATFIHKVVEKFPELELKQRIEHITLMLKEHLPGDYVTALDIIEQALPPELDPTKTDDDFGDFIMAPLSHFVASYGCTKTHLERSLSALKKLTRRFSAEDAIRYFINAFPEQTMTFLIACSKDENYHVRRLASEGTRPKLPWCQKITIGHKEPLSILDTLYSDTTRYVTRSVANHLNDLSKVDPEFVIDCLDRWQKSNQQNTKEMAFITRHSLRTLVKKGHPGALKLLGFGEPADISNIRFETLTPSVKIGESLVFELEFEANKQQNLMIDYVMIFPAEKNKTTQKVFKLKQLEVKGGQQQTLTKKHPMRLMTTRRLYPGKHHVKLQINGEMIAEFVFMLMF